MKITIEETEISRAELQKLNKSMLLPEEVLIIAMIHADNELSKDEKKVTVWNLHFSNVLYRLKELKSLLEKSTISDIL